jgi:DnaJ-domain-containing protein 1
MQITIDAPDNLPHDFIQLQIKELEAKLKQHANRLISANTSTKEQAIMQISKRCASLPELDHRSSDEIICFEMGLMS